MYYKFLSIQPNQYILSPSKIDIWQFSLNRPILDSHQLLLSEDECTRADRYYFERHRRRFINARTMLRQILSRYRQCQAQDLLFKYNPQGKPSLDAQSIPITFNLSHSQEFALLAIGLHHELGVDLEYFSGRPYQGIGQHLFSNQENKFLENIATSLKPLTFFNIWAQKEAFIKAIGLGLSYPTSNMTVPLLQSDHQNIINSIDDISWKITSFYPMPLYAAAICYHPSVENIYYGCI